MKEFLTYFGVFFVVLFTVGFINGRMEAHEPNFLKKYIFSSVKVTSINKEVYLAYLRKDTNLYVYNVDSNKLIQFDKEALLKKSELVIPDKGLRDYVNKTLVGGLGGGALGYTIKDVFQNSSTIGEVLKTSRGWGRVLGIVLGSISGYKVGHWAAIRYTIPAEDSREYAMILTEEANWTEGKTILFNALRQETQDKIDGLEKGSKRFELELFQRVNLTFLAVDTQKKINITSRALMAQLRLRNRAADALYRQDGFLAWKAIFSSWLNTCIFLAALGLLGFIVFCIGGYVTEHYTFRSKFSSDSPKTINEALHALSEKLGDEEKKQLENNNETEVLKLTNLKKQIAKAWFTPRKKAALYYFLKDMGIERTDDMVSVLLLCMRNQLRELPVNVDTIAKQFIRRAGNQLDPHS